MKVSVITPCYNSAAYIVRAIASVQAQSLSDWEMIVVDDGSSDESAAIVEQIIQVDSRVKLLRKENGGSASARKMGLQCAQGEYIQFLDADDTISPDKLERQVSFMEQNRLDVSYTDWRRISEDGTISHLRGGHMALLRVALFWGVFGTLPIHAFMYRNSFLKKSHIQIDTSVRQREDWNFHIDVFRKNPIAARLEGYDGAQYHMTQNSKTAGSNPLRIHLGSLQFLLYKILHSQWWLSSLLLIRLSIEFWFLFLHIISYRAWNGFLIWATCFQNKQDICISIFALCLMPLTLLIMVVYVILTRINFLRKKVYI